MARIVAFGENTGVSQSGIPIYADTQQLSRLARALRDAGPEVWKECRAKLRAAGQIVADDAKLRSSPFSGRIEYSIHVRTTASGNVKVIAGGESAPDAAAIENRGKGFVRHPVFGNREVWTDKNSHPAFLAPALDANADRIVEIVETGIHTAIDAAMRAH